MSEEAVHYISQERLAYFEATAAVNRTPDHAHPPTLKDPDCERCKALSVLDTAADAMIKAEDEEEEWPDVIGV